MSYWILSTVAFVSFLSQVLSVFFVFRKVESTGNGRYRLLQAQFLGTWGVFFYLLYQGIPSSEVLQLVSAAGVVLASVLFFYCSLLMKQNKLSIVFSEDSPEFHISRGPYSWVRHPFYTSYIVTYVALSVAVQNVYFALLCVGMIATYYRAARFEEKKFLASSLRESYMQYRQSTGMFFPVKLPFSRSSDHASSRAS